MSVEHLLVEPEALKNGVLNYSSLAEVDPEDNMTKHIRIQDVVEDKKEELYFSLTGFVGLFLALPSLVGF